MKKYLTFFRIRFIMGLQYRAAALAGIVTQFAWGFLEILVYRAFYDAAPEQFPMSFSAVVCYIWLQQAFLAFFAAWQMEGEIFESIRNGNIAYELCRPVHIYSMWFSRNAALRLSRAVLRCFPILLVAAFLPEPYGMRPPADVRCFFLFLLTLILGLFVIVSLCMIAYTLTFFMVSPEGVRTILSPVVEFFSGAIIPLPFFPQKIQAFMELLPFASSQNVPLRIYSGSMSAGEIQKAVFLQVFWLVVMIAAGSVLCRRAERKTIVQGG